MASIHNNRGNSGSGDDFNQRGESAGGQEGGGDRRNGKGHRPSLHQSYTGSNTFRRPRRTMNFARYMAEGNHLINQVAAELGLNRNSAARVTRAVLHALRDRLPPVDAVEFAQGLPMALKGVYFDQYELAHKPVLLRHPEEFIDYVCYKDGRMARYDFPDEASVEKAVSAVFRVLERNMDYGQVEQVRKQVNEELLYMMC